MLDFPNSPALNQIFTSGNLLWTWDGTKWLPASSGATAYVAKAGDTMTGNLIVNPGSVGIGTTAPGSKLTVSANTAAPPAVLVPAVDEVLAAYGADGQAAYVSTRSTFPGFQMIAYNGTLASPTAIGNGQSLGQLQARGYDGTVIGTGARIGFVASALWNNASHGVAITFSTSAVGGTSIAEAMRIDHNGNVGIGTTAPTSKLTVNANTATPQAPTSGTVLHVAAIDGATPRLLSDAYAASGSLTFRRANGSAGSPAPLANGDTILSISTNGYGTSAYGFGLQIVGVATEAWTNTARGSAIHFDTVPNTTATQIEAMRIDHNGRIGIGATNPGSKVDIVCGSGTGLLADQGLRLTDGAAGPQTLKLGVNAPASATSYGYIQASWEGNVNNNLALNPLGGNVGIGTTGPNAKFHVRGQSAAGGPSVSMISNGPVGADSTSWLLQFTDYGAGTTCGIISRTGTNSVAYQTTSDARLKDAITESNRGLDALMAIKVSDYKMGDTQQQGLLAQQVAEHYPEAVHEGGEDPALEPWMIDYGRLTPLIIKAFQDLKAEFDAFKAAALPVVGH